MNLNWLRFRFGGVSEQAEESEAQRLRNKILDPARQPKEYERTDAPDSWEEVGDQKYESLFYKLDAKHDDRYPQEQGDFTEQEVEDMKVIGFQYINGKWLHPLGPLGLTGPGKAPGEGLIRAVDPILFRQGENGLEILVVKNVDGRGYALPGGKVDPVMDGPHRQWEHPVDALGRELAEEVSWRQNTELSDQYLVQLIQCKQKLGELVKVYDAPWVLAGDPRDTDTTAWASAPYAVLLDADEADFPLQAKDADEIDDIGWEPVTVDLMKNMFAEHGRFVQDALKKMAAQKILKTTSRVKALVKAQL